MSIIDAAALAARVLKRETLGAVVRAKVDAAAVQDRIAKLMHDVRSFKPQHLEREDFLEAGQQWGVEPAVLHAIANAESGATKGFDERGRITILVEPHLFSALTNHAFDRTRPEVSYPQWTPYQKGAAPPAGFHAHPYTFSADERWGLFQRMAELDYAAACGSVSAGRFQQVTGSPRENMGWKLLRYPSAEALLLKLATSERDQLEVLHLFLLGTGLKPALRSMDWMAIARAYNGPGQAQAYSVRLQQCFKQCARLYV